MKSKLLLGLALVLSGLFSTLPAHAVMTFIQLDSTNINDQDFTIKITTKETGDNVRFLVFIKSKDATHPISPDATLTVKDGEKQIVECSLEKTPGDNGVDYDFTVSSKYLATSQFSFGFMLANHENLPTGCIYTLYLKDFANEK